MSDVIIYHNPKSGTSRNTLALIRNGGIEPQVIEYLTAPPERQALQSMIQRLAASSMVSAETTVSKRPAAFDVSTGVAVLDFAGS